MTTFQPTFFLEKLNSKLSDIDSPEDGDIKTTQQGAQLTESVLRELEDSIRSANLSTAEEIAVFKTIKPQITGRLMYYMKLMSIQQTMPSILEDRQALLRAHQEQIGRFIQDQLAMHTYYVMQWDHFDELFFTRKRQKITTLDPTYYVFADGRVNTLESYRFSQFYANDLLSDFISRQSGSISALEDLPDIRWTGTQAEATELLYGLNELSKFNGKIMPIRILKVWWEKVFKVSLGNVYKNHENNRLRKKSRTPLFDNGRLALLRRYDHDDMHALG